MDKQEEVKLVIGAGIYNNNPGWIHTQEEELSLLKKKQWKDKFNSVTAILAEHVWEHLTFEEGIEAAKNCLFYNLLGIYVVQFQMDIFQMMNIKIWSRPGVLDQKTIFVPVIK